MNSKMTAHPIALMHENAQHLRDKARFTAKRAHDHAECARKTTADLAALDIEGTLANLRKMVSLVGGKSRHAQSPAHQATVHHLALAAE